MPQGNYFNTAIIISYITFLVILKIGIYFIKYPKKFQLGVHSHQHLAKGFKSVKQHCCSTIHLHQTKDIIYIIFKGSKFFFTIPKALQKEELRGRLS
jgi:hypothetical protein